MKQSTMTFQFTISSFYPEVETSEELKEFTEDYFNSMLEDLQDTEENYATVTGKIVSYELKEV